MFDYEDELVDYRVRAYAVEHNLDMFLLDWHLEANHGWERHDRGYEEAIVGAANCVRSNTCDGKPIDKTIRKR